MAWRASPAWERDSGLPCPSPKLLLRHSNPLARLVVGRRIRVKVHGAEHVPASGPVILASNLTRVFKDYRQRLLNARVMMSLRRALFDRLLHLPLPQVWDMKTGGILSRLTGDVETTTGLLQMAIVSPAISVIRLIIAIGILMALNWRLALTAMAILPGVMLASFTFARRIRPIYRAVRKDVELIDGRVGETFAGIRIVRAFRREMQELLTYMIEACSDRFVSALRVLAEVDEPVVFHCAAGKDRTGVLAALVLALLGVDEHQIAADYSLSGLGMVRMREWLQETFPGAIDRMAQQLRFRHLHQLCRAGLQDGAIGGITLDEVVGVGAVDGRRRRQQADDLAPTHLRGRLDRGCRRLVERGDSDWPQRAIEI